jgi:hypothetical protein
MMKPLITLIARFGICLIASATYCTLSFYLFRDALILGGGEVTHPAGPQWSLILPAAAAILIIALAMFGVWGVVSDWISRRRRKAGAHDGV